MTTKENKEKAIELNPTKISYHTGIAAVYLDTRQYDNAEKHLEIAKKIEPKNRRVAKF